MESVAVRRASTFGRIRDVACDLMCELGYKGMSMRRLASKVGVQAGSLYNFVESKQLLLFELINQHEKDLLDLLRDKKLTESTNAVQMLSLLWEKVATFGSRQARAVRLAKAEIHHLDPMQASAIAHIRHLQQQELLGLISGTAGDIGLSQKGLEKACEELHVLLVCQLNIEAEPYNDPTHLIRRQLRTLSARLLLKRD